MGKKSAKDEDMLNKWKFSNQNWKRVLTEICNYAPNKYGRGNIGYAEGHPRASHFKITPHELMLIMSFLEEQGLIEYDKSEHNWIILTSKGFDVALQNESAYRSHRNSKTALFLSLAITILALTSLLSGITNLLDKWVVTVVVAAALIIGGVIIKNMK